MTQYHKFFHRTTKRLRLGVYVLCTFALIMGVFVLAACRGPNSSVNSPPTLKIAKVEQKVTPDSKISFTAELADANGPVAVLHDIVSWRFEVQEAQQETQEAEPLAAETLQSYAHEGKPDDGSYTLDIELDMPVGALITVYAVYELDKRATDSITITVEQRDFTVTGITITPIEAEVYRSDVLILDAEIAFDPPGAEIDTTVEWRIESGIEGDSLGSPFGLTGDNQRQLQVSERLDLWEPKGEPRTITLRALANAQKSQSSTATITVPWPVVDEVAITAETSTSVEPLGMVRFTADVKEQYNAPKEVQWIATGQLDPNTGFTDPNNPSTLIVGDDEPKDTVITVHAESQFDNQKKSNEITVTVLPKQLVTVTNLAIQFSDDTLPHFTEGSDQFAKQGSSYTLQAIPTFDTQLIVPEDGTWDINWTIESKGHAGTTDIDKNNGLLVVDPAEQQKAITVKAQLSYQGRPREIPGTLTIQVPSVDAIRLNPATISLDRGKTSEAFTASVTGRGNPDTSVRWALSGTVDAGTQFDEASKTVSIGQNQTPGTLTLTATSTLTTSTSGRAEITVNAPVVTSVTVTAPSTTSVHRGGNIPSFMATVAGEGFPDQGVDWIVEGTSNTSTTFNGNTLVIAKDQEPGALSVVAVSQGAPNVRSNPVAITVLNPIIGNITVNPASFDMPRNSQRELTHAFEDHTGYPAVTVTWDFVDSPTLAAGTRFEGNTLHTGPEQGPIQFTVRATASAQYATTNKTFDVQVNVLAITVSSVTITPKDRNVVRGGTDYTFTSNVALQNGTGANFQTVTWTLDAGSAEKHPGTTFDSATRILTVDKDQLPGTLTLKATSDFDNNYSDTATITVGRPTVASVTITGQDVSSNTVRVLRGKTLQLSATVNGQTGTGHPEQSIGWELLDTAGGSITADGLLTVNNDFDGNGFTVTAKSTGSINAVQNSANLSVTIPPEPRSVEIFNEPGAVNRGEFSGTIRAVVTGKGSPVPQNVTWSLHKTDGTRYPNDETLDGTEVQNGVLTVGGKEQYSTSSVVVRATAVGYDNVYANTSTISITGNRVVGDWRMVKTGIDHVMAITWEGRKLYTWGRNAYGQLGQGNRNNSTDPDVHTHNLSVPTEVITPGVTNQWRSVEGGWAHTIALHMDNTIWVTGRLAVGGVNAVIKDYGNHLTKVTVSGLSDDGWKAVYASHSAVFAIRTDGTMYAWGSDDGRLLGTEVSGNKTEPTKVNIPLREDGTAEEFKLISASANHVLALTTDGRLFGWGSNSQGQLADASGSAPQEIKISSLPNIRWETVSTGLNWSAGIIAGEFDEATNSLSTAKAGHLYTWGENTDGRLGHGTNTNNAANRSPARIGGSTTFRAINMNSTSFGVAIDTNGKLWSWGKEEHGQLGRGANLLNADKWSPQEIQYGSKDPTQDLADFSFSAKNWITSITGGSFALAIDSEGELWAWGHNQHGMLGNGEEGGTGNAVNRASANRNRPIKVKDLKDIGIVP